MAHALVLCCLGCWTLEDSGGCAHGGMWVIAAGFFMHSQIQGFRRLAVVLACECRGTVSCDMFCVNITILPTAVKGNMLDKIMTNPAWHVVCEFLTQI